MSKQKSGNTQSYRRAKRVTGFIDPTLKKDIAASAKKQKHSISKEVGRWLGIARQVLQDA